MTELIETNPTNIKLYSPGAIAGATFLGGPLAAGYLIGENFKALNNPKDGRISLIIGIIATIVIFVVLYMIPENVFRKVPGQLIPIIYTGIIWGIVEWKQGDILKAHKKNNNPFFSGWRAAGVGLISLLIIGIGIFGYVFLSTDEELNSKYDAEIAQFTQNENETLVFYDNLGVKSDRGLVLELNKNILKWKENIKILNRARSIEGLPNNLKRQNEILLRYSELRIQAFELFRKSIQEDTDQYSQELEQIHIAIDKEVSKLN